MENESWRTATWKDAKGRSVLIHTMSNKWLNNIRKYFREGDGRENIKPIMDEIKRRKTVRKKRGIPMDNVSKQKKQ